MVAARIPVDPTEAGLGLLRRCAQWLRLRVPGRLRRPLVGTSFWRRSRTVAPEASRAVLTDASAAHRRVRFDFRAREGATTMRDVEPYRLVESGQHSYLVAYDPGRADWRTFRLDRMRVRLPLGPRFEPRAMPTDGDAPYLGATGPVPRAPDPAAAASTVRWAREMTAPGAAVVLDTETTDLPGAICEIAVVDAATGETLLDTLVNPRSAVSARAREVHGIADDELARAPTWAAVLPRLLDVTAGRQVLAYNVEFDAGVIRADTARYGLSLGALDDADRWDCVMVRRARALPDGSALALGAGHRAHGDALAALEVLRGLAAMATE